MFNKCTDVDDYMSIFAKLLSSALDLFTPWKKQYNKHRVLFPKYMMKLIHKKVACGSLLVKPVTIPHTEVVV